jgi:hypothetical protein
MTKQDAHSLLNACKVGFPAPEAAITEALMATGDLDPPAPSSPVFWKQPEPSYLNRSTRVMRETV